MIVKVTQVCDGEGNRCVMVKVTQLCDSEGNTALIAALCQEKHRHGPCFFPAVAAKMFGLCSLHSLKGALWAGSQLGFSHCGARPEAFTPNTFLLLCRQTCFPCGFVA